MTFKANWEKTDQQFQLPKGAVEAMVNLAFPHKKLVSQEVISGGCANLNVKIDLEGSPFILRVYLRDRNASYREQAIGALVKQEVPVPQVYFVGDFGDYHFSIAEYIPGITLRDLLLGQQEHDVGKIMRDVGRLLVSFQRFTYPKSGFFDEALVVQKELTASDLVDFAHHCLENPKIQKYLKNQIPSIERAFEKHVSLLNNPGTPCLVHADFDPANILVDRREGEWKVSGVLDWEFAYAGYWLNDVANMLRYAHQMPPVYEQAFLQGVEEAGAILPSDWRVTTYLFNMDALLDSMVRHPLEKEPNICKDICNLFDHILGQLDKQK